MVAVPNERALSLGWGAAVVGAVGWVLACVAAVLIDVGAVVWAVPAVVLWAIAAVGVYRDDPTANVVAVAFGLVCGAGAATWAVRLFASGGGPGLALALVATVLSITVVVGAGTLWVLEPSRAANRAQVSWWCWTARVACFAALLVWLAYGTVVMVAAIFVGSVGGPSGMVVGGLTALAVVAVVTWGWVALGVRVGRGSRGAAVVAAVLGASMSVGCAVAIRKTVLEVSFETMPPRVALAVWLMVWAITAVTMTAASTVVAVRGPARTTRTPSAVPD